MLWPSPVLNYCCITILQQLYLDICHAHLICQYQKIIGCQGAETLHFYCLYGIGFSACDLCSCSWSVDYIRMFYSQLTGCKYNHHHMKSKCGHMVTTAVLLSHHHHMDLDHIFWCGPLHKLYRYIAFPGDNFHSCIRNKSISLSWKHFYSVQIL